MLQLLQEFLIFDFHQSLIGSFLLPIVKYHGVLVFLANITFVLIRKLPLRAGICSEKSVLRLIITDFLVEDQFCMIQFPRHAELIVKPILNCHRAKTNLYMINLFEIVNHFSFFRRQNMVSLQF